MTLVFELLFPLFWLWLLSRLWRQDRWLGSLLVAFYFVCLVLEAVAIRFGEYHYGPLAVAVCPGLTPWRVTPGCAQPSLCLPLAVPCLEGLLFFAGWIWAQRRETAAALRPLAASVMAVMADLIFDPVAARGRLCGSGEGSWDGIGLWTWLLDPADPGHYFGIPIDNPLAWLASCLGFGYAAFYLPRWRGIDTASLSGGRRATLAAQVSLLGLILAGVVFAALDLLVTPPGSGETYRLAMLFGLLGALYAFLLVRAWRRPAAAGPNTADLPATAGVAAALLYALAGLALGYDQPAIYPLWLLVAAALVAYWAAISRTPFSMRRTISGRPSSETEQIARRR